MTAAVAGFECGSEVERARAAARRRACNEDHESVLSEERRLYLSLVSDSAPKAPFSASGKPCMHRFADALHAVSFIKYTL